MSGRRIHWTEDKERRLFIGHGELSPGRRERLFAIIAPGSWNDCRLLFNDGLHGHSQLKFLRGTGSQSCKIMAGTIEQLHRLGTVKLDRLTWCRQYTGFGKAYWTELDPISWVNFHRATHPAWEID